MTPYYQDDLVTIYHGDCREIVDSVTDVALVVTDPPYGIDWRPRVNHQDSPWVDRERPNVDHLLVGDHHCIWGGNYFADQLPVVESWLIWAKRPEGPAFDRDTRSYSVCEMAWTDYGSHPRIKHHVWDGGLRAGDASNRQFLHPAQKPLEIMVWSIALAPVQGPVLDPYMGSGTTLVAAKSLGRRASTSASDGPKRGADREDRTLDLLFTKSRDG